MSKLKKWEIHLMDFSPAEGSEQRGRRPGIVVSNSIINKGSRVVMAIPLTSLEDPEKKLKYLRYPSNVYIDSKVHSIDKDSAAIVSQIRPMDEVRIIKKMSEVSDFATKNKINDAINHVFNLNGCHDCAIPIHPNTLKCVKCNSVIQKKCKTCSNIVPYSHKFCHNCGGRF